MISNYTKAIPPAFSFTTRNVIHGFPVSMGVATEYGATLSFGQPELRYQAREIIIFCTDARERMHESNPRAIPSK